MKGIQVDKAGGPYKLVEGLEKPSPGKGQVLVKSLVTAINPAEGYMQGTGLLVTQWPIVLGCDASGTVVEVGEGVTKFKVGDGIYGCTSLGIPGHSTFQEYHIMNERVSFKKPANVTTEEAATIGVGLLTAGLGLTVGLKIELEPKPVTPESPWIVVIGAAGSVGQYAIQIAKYTGYKVLAACSPSNNEFVTSIGANAVFNYKLPPDEQIAEIEKVTGGNYLRVFDASAMAGDFAVAALAQHKSNQTKYLSTTNDWSPIEPKEGVEVFMVALGEIGRSGSAEIEKNNADIANLIVEFEKLVASGQIKPLDYVQVGDVGVGEILKALDAFNSHKSGKKIIVRVARD